MNNPGIELEIWKQLKAKWAELDAKGHKLKIEFKLITEPDDKSKVLVIDVIQHIDNETVTETVQRKAGEAYAILDIAGLSMERLIGIYKDMLNCIVRQINVVWT
jgi:hypothetical protein